MTEIVNRVPFDLLASGRESTMPSFFDGEDWFDIGGGVVVSPYAGNHQRHWWHFQAKLPPILPGVAWISMITSVLAVSVGKTEWENVIGLPQGGPNYMFRAYAVDSAAPQVIGAPMTGVFALDWPAPPGDLWNPWVLIGQDMITGLMNAANEDVASITAWEENWFTECIGFQEPLGDVSKNVPNVANQVTSTVRLPNQRSGATFDWLEPKWRIPVRSGGGGYFVAPFPSTVDLWLAMESYTSTGVYDRRTGVVPVGSPMSPPQYAWTPTPDEPLPPFVFPAVWDFPLLELIIVSCLPASTVSGSPGPPGIVCHDGPLGVGVHPPVTNQYSLRDLVYLAASVGCFGSNVPTAAAVAMAESGGDPLAQGQDAGPPPSTDRGLWQINDAAHPEVSDQCAYNPVCCAQAACTISSSGTDWTPWATFNSGAYLTFLAAAEAIYSAM